MTSEAAAADRPPMPNWPDRYTAMNAKNPAIAISPTDQATDRLKNHRNPFR
jgi:hypothetical protein